MAIRIGGEKRGLWRAVDDEGMVLDMLVQHRRNSKAALRLLAKLEAEARRHMDQASMVLSLAFQYLAILCAALFENDLGCGRQPAA